MALGLALTGLVLLVGPSDAAGPGTAAGALLALVAAAAFATMTGLNRRSVPGLGPLPLTATSFTLGGILLLPVAAVAGPGLAVPSDAAGLGARSRTWPWCPPRRPTAPTSRACGTSRRRRPPCSPCSSR